MLRTTLLALAILLPPKVPAQSIAPVRERQFPLGVVDATGKPMGPYLQVDARQAFAMVKVNGIVVPLTLGGLPVTDSSGTWRDPSRLVPRGNVEANVFFDAPLCQGNAYIPTETTLIGFTPAIVVAEDFGPRAAVHIARSVPPSQVLLYSVMSSNFFCENLEAPRTNLAFPTLPAVDLSTVFKAPYSVK